MKRFTFSAMDLQFEPLLFLSPANIMATKKIKKTKKVAKKPAARKGVKKPAARKSAKSKSKKK
jgi:hypothetical protein